MFNITLATVATLQHCLEISALRVTRVTTNDVLPYFYGCILIGFILQINLIYNERRHPLQELSSLILLFGLLGSLWLRGDRLLVRILLFRYGCRTLHLSFRGRNL